MWGILGKIFGSSDVVDKGISLIDEAFYTDSEKAEDEAKSRVEKTKAKINLMKAYAPFKVAQRYLALMFGLSYISTYILVLVMYFLDKSVTEVMSILEMFQINYVVLIIVTFYFGSGAIEGISRRIKK